MIERAHAVTLVALLLGCSDSTGAGGGGAAGGHGAGGAPSGGGGASSEGGSAGHVASGGGGAGGGEDACATALLCETFDDYAGVTGIADAQAFGPWHAQVIPQGATMGLDGAHTTSGERALHVQIDQGVTAGGRLFADGDLPLFAGQPTRLYGRMMMYVDPNGPSIHWTFFGASGDAEPSSPVAGRRATYLMSSLPRDGANTYSFVYGLAAADPDPYHDCWFQSEAPMPTAGWTCVTFEMDSVARHLEMSIDGGPDPIAVVDDHGQGCVGDVPGDSGWYGPVVDEIYVGAFSFHDMEAPLEVWIDDLVLDDAPLSCP